MTRFIKCKKHLILTCLYSCIIYGMIDENNNNVEDEGVIYMSDKRIFSFELAGRPLTFEIGELAKQANASVLVRYGDTVVLSTCVASKEPKDLDFFPLMISYE